MAVAVRSLRAATAYLLQNMKKLPHFDANAPGNLPTRKERYARFLKEQAAIVKFITEQGATFAMKGMATLATHLVFEVWEHFDAAMGTVPPLHEKDLARHYEANRVFIEQVAGRARDQGFENLSDAVKARPHSEIRLFALATLFDNTQTRMIGPEDRVEAPDLVGDQNQVHALLGAVLEALDELWQKHEEEFPAQ